jgi:hypothetical protein
VQVLGMARMRLADAGCLPNSRLLTSDGFMRTPRRSRATRRSCWRRRALKGIKRTLNLIEAAASLAAEAWRKCESLMAAACESQDIKAAQLAFTPARS